MAKKDFSLLFHLLFILPVASSSFAFHYSKCCLSGEHLSPFISFCIMILSMKLLIFSHLNFDHSSHLPQQLNTSIFKPLFLLSCYLCKNPFYKLLQDLQFYKCFNKQNLQSTRQTVRMEILES